MTTHKAKYYNNTANAFDDYKSYSISMKRSDYSKNNQIYPKTTEKLEKLIKSCTDNSPLKRCTM
jgi:hypothetical protein